MAARRTRGGKLRPKRAKPVKAKKAKKKPSKATKAIKPKPKSVKHAKASKSKKTVQANKKPVKAKAKKKAVKRKKPVKKAVRRRRDGGGQARARGDGDRVRALQAEVSRLERELAASQSALPAREDELAEPVTAVRERVPLRQIPRPRVKEIKAGESFVKREIESSWFSNVREPDKAGEILMNMLERASAKGPFSTYDLPIFEFGLKFVGEGDLKPILPFLDALNSEGVEANIARTPVANEVYIKFNVGEQPVLADGAADILTDNRKLLERIYRELMDEWGASGWFVWAEMDEQLYG